jgi:hypothetical protein
VESFCECMNFLVLHNAGKLSSGYTTDGPSSVFGSIELVNSHFQLSV